MSDNTKALLNKYGIFIILGALAVLVGILAIVNSVQQSQGLASRSISKEYQNLEDASIKYIELSLAEHYVSEGEYPTDTDGLIERKEGDTKDTLIKAMDSLNEFRYAVRGDDQAYRITFTSRTGEKKTVEGNYKEDYQ